MDIIKEVIEQVKIGIKEENPLDKIDMNQEQSHTPPSETDGIEVIPCTIHHEIKNSDFKEDISDLREPPVDQEAPIHQVMDVIESAVDDYIYKLAYDYQPIFVLHKNEEAFPASFEYTFSKSQLYNNDKLVADYGEITPDMIKNNLGNRLKINPELYGGLENKFSSNHRTNEVPDLVINDVPVYVKIQKTSSGIVEEYIDILYFVYFMYNSPYKICCKDVGAHDSDIEHVRIVFKKSQDKLTAKPVAMYFSYHSEGKWLNMDKVKLWPGSTRPIVYCSKGSHAMYWAPITKWRIFGCANDETSDETSGIPWSGPLCILNDKDNDPYWLLYKGHFSMDGIDALRNRSYYHNRNSLESSTSIRDTCFPCLSYPICYTKFKLE